MNFLNYCGKLFEFLLKLAIANFLWESENELKLLKDLLRRILKTARNNEFCKSTIFDISLTNLSIKLANDILWLLYGDHSVIVFVLGPLS